MKHKNIKDISHDICVGCTACVNACPKHCIKMEMNKEGFLYPVIDVEQCINCGICYKSCPTVSVKKQERYPRAIGMINRSKRIRMASSSGGVFYSLAQALIEAGGVVCAATIDDGAYVKHIMIDSVNQIDEVAKSKYVQSDLGNCYSLIQNLLEKEKKVLFVGTPCQVYGLYTFLRKDYENLFLVDLICHGVPSPKIWHEFVEDKEIQRNAECKYISFRDQTIEGWKNFGMKIEFSDGTKYIDTQKQNAYMFGFLRGFIDRRCCYDCQFKGLNRCSDLTLGDFWAVDSYIECFNDNAGTSLVYVNTKRGQRLIEVVRKKFYIKKIEEKRFWLLNNAYANSNLNMDNREKFYKKYFRNNNAIDILSTEMRRSKNYE